MEKTKAKKQSDKETLAEVTKEMAKPRVAASARESMSSAVDPMELLWEKVTEGIGCAVASEYLSKDSRAQSNANNLVAQYRHSLATLSDVKRVARSRGMQTLPRVALQNSASFRPVNYQRAGQKD
jgi:hypothetical protein